MCCSSGVTEYCSLFDITVMTCPIGSTAPASVSAGMIASPGRPAASRIISCRTRHCQPRKLSRSA
jgi:hypothetical protein